MGLKTTKDNYGDNTYKEKTIWMWYPRLLMEDAMSGGARV